MDNTILAGLGQTLCSVLNGLNLNSEPVFTLESTSGRIHLDIVWTTGKREQPANLTKSTEKKKRKSPSTRRRDKRRREAWRARKSGDALQPQPDTSASLRNSEVETTETAEPKQDPEVSASPRNPEAEPTDTKETTDDERKRFFSEPNEINDRDRDGNASIQETLQVAMKAMQGLIDERKRERLFSEPKEINDRGKGLTSEYDEPEYEPPIFTDKRCEEGQPSCPDTENLCVTCQKLYDSLVAKTKTTDSSIPAASRKKLIAKKRKKNTQKK